MNLQQTLNDISNSLALFGPELMLVTGIVLLSLLSFTTKINRRIIVSFCLAVTTLTAFLTLQSPDSGAMFSGMINRGSQELYFQILLDVSAMLTMVLLLMEPVRKKIAEYCLLLLTATLGGHLLIMADNLLMVFVAIELISIPSYFLTAWLFERKSAEGSFKYFIFGSVSSAIMLYGMTILYGLTGSLSITGLNLQSIPEEQLTLLLTAGMMTSCGLLFKLAAVPMHPWAPDVYESTPMSAAAFFSTMPKFAALSALIHIGSVLDGDILGSFQMMMAIVSIVTITVGNFSALAQKNARRMIAYSSIAHSGFMLIGVVVMNGMTIEFISFYAAVYLIANFLAFGYLQYFEKQGLLNVQQFAGIGSTLFWPSLFLMVAMVSLIGLPPTAGFTAKLLVFSGVWDEYQNSGNWVLLLLLLVGLFNTVVSLYYYLKIPFYAFLKQPQNFEKRNIIGFQNLFGLVMVLLLLLLFFQPGVLMGWINKLNFVF